MKDMDKKSNEIKSKVNMEIEEISPFVTDNDEDTETINEQKYQKAMNLMNSIGCMSPYQDKVDMYLEAEKQFSELLEYKDSMEMSEKCRQLAKVTEEEIKKNIYKKAKNLMDQAKKAEDYQTAVEEFQKIKGYEDADALALECDQSLHRIRKKSENISLIKGGALILGIAVILIGFRVPFTKYYLANIYEATGSYNSAIKTYKKIQHFKDSKERMLECRYKKGLKALAEGDYKNAKKAFEAAGDYKDSDEKKVEAEKLYIKNSSIGETIYIGTYKWMIMDIQDNQALLIKDQALPGIAYDTNTTPTTWEHSTIRNWLNTEFFDNNFTKAEKDNMILSNIKNDDNPIYGTAGGNVTQDYVFLLSIDEIRQYKDVIPELKSNSWLRSPGNDQNSAAFLSVNGLAMEYGYDKNSEDFRVKPAFWFNLD